MDEQAVWAPGSAVGAYTLLAKLATGGMAEIWLARQVGLRGFERMVVVKRIIESLSSDTAFVDMFLDEARIAAQLAHPNIVQIFDLGEHAGAYYIAMEYLAGEHLAAVARAAVRSGAPMAATYAVKIAVAALDGLAHAHGRVGMNGKPLNVVHRDVSPQNILLTWDGQVKLVDFGIARAANRSTQTQNNQLKGKFAYMAPEQAQGIGTLDGRADLFALGAILYELLTHQRLWQLEDQLQILTSLISADPIQPMHERNPAVPFELSVIVMRALAKNPAERWPDALSFKTALEDWLRPQGGGPSAHELSTLMHGLFKERIAQRTNLIETAGTGELTPARVGEVMRPPTERSMPGATSVKPPPPRSSFGLIAALAGGVLAALVLGGWLVTRAPKPPDVVEMPVPAQVAEVALVTPSAIAIETDPPGASVSIDGAAVGVAPLTLGDVKAGDHVIDAALAGFLPVKRTVRVAAPGEKLMVLLTLPKDPKRKPAAPAGQGSKGKLSLSTNPWTRVSLEGKTLGDTPLIGYSLPAGRHRLRLVNEEKKLDVNIEVEVKAGQVTKKVLRL